MKVLLSEGLGSAVMIYLIVKRLAAPFTSWKAYELGIIDEKGVKLKKPQTSEERKSWTLFDKFIWNLKKILNKFVGHSRAAAILTTAYLLKDNLEFMIKDENFLLEHEYIIKDMTISKQRDVFIAAKLISEKLILVESEEIEDSVYRHFDIVQGIFTEEEIEELFDLWE